jgi:hypothetical protein
MKGRPSPQLLLIACVSAVLLAACGGSGDNTNAPANPTPVIDPTAARGPIAPPSYCEFTIAAAPSLNLQVSARWEGDDRIVAKGSATLPGPATLQAWVCQDGQMTVELQPKEKPELRGGRIDVEWRRTDATVGPVFDPNATFEVVLAVTGQPIAVPYFVVRIPVEGRPGG